MTSPPDQRFAYADASRLLAQTWDALLPPRAINPADHATANRWMKSASGGHLERYDASVAPYLRAPLARLGDDLVDTVAVIGPGASGKTVIADNWLLYSIDADPAEMLWYLHTEPAQRAYVQGRMEGILDLHDKLLGHLRHGRDSVEMKRFRGGRVEFLPFTGSTLVNKHVARIVADEYDSFDPSLGDPLALLNPRRQAAQMAGGDSKLLIISHPDQGQPLSTPVEQQRGIMRVYMQSDRHTWWWACPHCRGFSSPTPGAEREMVLTWPEDAPLDVIEARAALSCPLCGADIAEPERRGMLATGRWVAAGQVCEEDGRITGEAPQNRTAGYWITGLMSPFVLGGLGGMAKALAAAIRDAAATGDDAGLRQVKVKTLGVPHAPPRQVGNIEATALAERAEAGLHLGMVPEGARFLSVGVDVQANRWELLTRGYGEGLESWVVDVRTIPGDPATDEAAWQRLFAELATLSYPLADGSGRHMRARIAVVDAVGQPGVTEQAYAAWRWARKAGLIRRHGKINGRDAFNVMLARGASTLQAAPLSVSYPDAARKDRKATARGEIPLLVFNSHAAKDHLAAQLGRVDPGPGHVHFPAALRAEAPPHPWFEQLAAERRDPRRGWQKLNAQARNEAWDLLVMSAVAARLHGLHRLDWANPPAWAAPWDANSQVGAPPTLAAPAAAAGPVTVPPAPAAAPIARPAVTPPAPALAPRGVVIAAAQAVSSLARRLA